MPDCFASVSSKRRTPSAAIKAHLKWSDDAWKPDPGLSPLKNIRRWCLECVEGAAEVARCTGQTCPLYPYRFGRNPNIKGGTPPDGAAYRFKPK